VIRNSIFFGLKSGRYQAINYPAFKKYIYLEFDLRSLTFKIVFILFMLICITRSIVYLVEKLKGKNQNYNDHKKEPGVLGFVFHQVNKAGHQRKNPNFRVTIRILCFWLCSAGYRRLPLQLSRVRRLSNRKKN